MPTIAELLYGRCDVCGTPRVKQVGHVVCPVDGRHAQKASLTSS